MTMLQPDDESASPQISVGQNIRNPRSLQTVDMVQWFQRNIQLPAYEQMLEEVARGERAKDTLPYALWSGVFERRRNEGLITHSGRLCLDFDNVDPVQASTLLADDPYAEFGFRSASRTGYKAVFRIDGEHHAQSFEWLHQHCLSTYGLEADRACKDVARACFVSFDPQAWAKEAEVCPYEMPTFNAGPKELTTPSLSEKGDRPGDRYNASPDARAEVQRILLAQGWTTAREVGDKLYMTRPGKQSGVSATIHANGNLWVFTDSTDLEANSYYTPFYLYARYQHGGDYRAAAQEILARDPSGAKGPRDLGAEWYGKKQREEQSSSTVVPFSAESAEGEEHEEEEEEKNPWPPIIDGVEAVPENLAKLKAIHFPELIEGILQQGMKMIISSGSKAGKSWMGLHLAASIASGRPWLGMNTRRCEVLYLNFEIQGYFFAERLKLVRDAMKLSPEDLRGLKVWNLRGFTASLEAVTARLREVQPPDTRLIVIDPVYKLLRGRDENNAGEMEEAMREIDSLIAATGCAVLYIHHFSKGNKSETESIDRASGSGVFARDPDTIVTLTEHEEEEHLTVDLSLRNSPPQDSFVVRKDFPLFFRAESQDPRQLKTPNQKITSADVYERVAHSPAGVSPDELCEALAFKYDVTTRTVQRNIRKLIDAGRIHKTRGVLFTGPGRDNPDAPQRPSF